MYKLDINKGDIILRGKYRNKKEVVKTFGHDEKGQPTINGKRILNFNIEKLLPKKEVKEAMKKSELKELIKECIQELNENSYKEKLKTITDMLNKGKEEGVVRDWIKKNGGSDSRKLINWLEREVD